ncbi:hypothetical protein GA0004736_1433 [Curtobacterium sp. 9128]|uniref:hypothetical protein n=1 Tax=Curtobacterium sp. 9128 TaxID=1793722 RepID=UPI0007D72CB9|nr:hypothetical protein [Curtobacterium sp. 9128]SBN62530.1 hypothetical protein GA0004736_1433 [Curtobacterium sp. 9128]
MKHIIYGLATVLTTDDAAYAVLEYAAALAQAGLADTVHVPTVDRWGMATTSSILLAPAIGLLVQSAPDDELHPETEGFTSEMRWRTRAVQTAH